MRMKANKEKYIKLYLFPILSGILYGLGWNFNYLSFLMLFCIVPFLFSLDYIRKKEENTKVKIRELFFAVLLFRAPIVCVVLCWMIDISLVALFLLILTEVVLFTISMLFLLFRKTPIIAVVVILVLYELVMQNVILLVPFYQIGYAWGNHIAFIQYYAFLGVEGGSLVLYLVNFAFFEWLRKKEFLLSIKIILMIFSGLTIYSLIDFYTSVPFVQDKTRKVSIIHCHFQSKDSLYLNYPIKLIDSVEKIAASNSLVILPEVFFNSFGWVKNLNNNSLVQHIDSLSASNQQEYVVGAYVLGRAKKHTPQTRYSDQYNIYYEVYNLSILMGKTIKLKSKQKFIPFFEYVPNNIITQWINKYIAKIGDDRKITPLSRNDHFSYKGVRFNTLLCYESLYPLIVARQAIGNDFMIIQANENWNESQLMSDQYFKVNKANTIQVGIPTYRSSNYGYSAIIQPNGKTKSLNNEDDSFSLLSGYLPKKEHTSFYCNIIGWSYWISAITLISLLLLAIIKRRGN